MDHNAAAIHLHPEKARELIWEGTQSALSRRAEIEPFWIDPPYEMVQTMRPGDDGEPPMRAVVLGDDLVEVLRQPLNFAAMPSD